MYFLPRSWTSLDGYPFLVLCLLPLGGFFSFLGEFWILFLVMNMLRVS